MSRRLISPGKWLLLTMLLGVTSCLRAAGQFGAAEPSQPDAAQGQLIANQPAQQAVRGSEPDAPGQAAGGEQVKGRIYGSVTDPKGNVVTGAKVTLEDAASKARQSLLTDNSGAFTFSDLPGGRYRITVIAKDFGDWTSNVTLSAGQYYDVPDLSLKVATANTNVEVVFTQYDVAEEQIKAQEQQRVLGVLPNFYISYVWHAAPMTVGQKFRLAVRTSVDPVTFAIAGATAGIEQGTNSFSGYGQGTEGYAKRFAASYADDVVDTFIGGAILPSILHQDPRYFYKGTGSISSRALYAISTVVICRGDDGRWEPNYSNVLGNLASAGISNLYYPASNRNGAGVTIQNALINTAEGAVSALLQEFLIKKISRGVPQTAPPSATPAAAKLN